MLAGSSRYYRVFIAKVLISAYGSDAFDKQSHPPSTPNLGNMAPNSGYLRPHRGQEESLGIVSQSVFLQARNMGEASHGGCVCHGCSFGGTADGKFASCTGVVEATKVSSKQLGIPS